MRPDAGPVPTRAKPDSDEVCAPGPHDEGHNDWCRVDYYAPAMFGPKAPTSESEREWEYADEQSENDKAPAIRIQRVREALDRDEDGAFERHEVGFRRLTISSSAAKRKERSD